MALKLTGNRAILSFTIFLFLIASLLCLRFGNPQWHKYIYMFQAYVYPGHPRGVILPPPKFTGMWIEWSETGLKRYQASYKDGECNGEAIFYYDNGEIYRCEAIRDGKPHGLSSGWYENGQKRFDVSWRNGKLHGWQSSFYENGNKKVERLFFNAILNGMGKKWYENGQIKTIGSYRNDKRHGKWLFWEENGTQKEALWFWNDEEISKEDFIARTVQELEKDEVREEEIIKGKYDFTDDTPFDLLEKIKNAKSDDND